MKMRMFIANRQAGQRTQMPLALETLSATAVLPLWQRSCALEQLYTEYFVQRTITKGGF